MKIRKFAFLLALVSALTLTTQAAVPKLVVTILVDQLRYDYLEKFHDQFTTNGFRLFTERGVFMTFARYNYYPTITGPGHASYLSGATPSVHGIVGNDWFDKTTRKQVYCCDDPSVSGVGSTSDKMKVSPKNFTGSNFSDQMRLHHRSKVVGVSMKDRSAILPAGKRPLGAYWFDSKSGTFVTSTYYATELPAWVNKFNDRKRPAEFVGQTWNRLLDAKFYQWSDDAPGEGTLTGEKTSTFPHTIKPSASEGFETFMPTPFGNQLLAEFARAAVEGEQLGTGPQPDVLCVSFSSIDYCGHKFGPYSHEVQDITLRLDRQLGEFFAYLDGKFGMNNVMVMLTADHGVAPTPEFAAREGLDGQRLSESQFMVELMGKLDVKFGAGKYFLTSKIYEGNLYFNHDTLQEKKISVAEVSSFIREWVLSTGKYQACFTRDQLLDGRAPGLVGQAVLNGFNAERCGDMVLIPKPFIIPGGSKSGTSHGSPFNYDTHVPVLFFGAAFKPGRYADEFYITDIAPTLCAALRIAPPSGCVGKPFVKALANP
ncbi:MAG: alkaline phosphatase family protein [Verrucomicrobia bacterium]|nr:alkaline phosphatase family protein [Verrucomicrobiota bacterium]